MYINLLLHISYYYFGMDKLHERLIQIIQAPKAADTLGQKKIELIKLKAKIREIEARYYQLKGEIKELEHKQANIKK